MENSRGNRRTFLGGIMASIGSVLLAKTAFAFPEGTQGLVNAATRLLRQFGVSVAAMFDARLGRDVLTFVVNPLDGTKYEQIVNAPDSFVVCWVTSSIGDFVEFTVFDPPGEADIKIDSQGGRSMIDILDPLADVRIMVGGNLYELEDGMLELVR